MAISYGKQLIEADDIDEVVRTLQSDFLTQGPKIQEFESLFSSRLGGTPSVAVSNGTAGLHLACQALGVDQDATVLAPVMSFAATSNGVLYNRGKVEFVDIDKRDALMDFNLIEDKLKKNPNRYRGLITVDYAGKPSPLRDLKALCERYGLWLIEDACHSLGAYSEDENGKIFQCGSRYADASVFSFHPVKHITTGEGGMVTTPHPHLEKKLKQLRTHGITKDPADFSSPDHSAGYHEMQSLGFNYRLCDIQAALGCSQMRKLDHFLKRRREIAASYDRFCDSLEIPHQDRGEEKGHSYHLYVIRHSKRDQLYSFLKEKNIFCQVHYIPICNHPYYRNLGYRPEDYPKAQKYYQETLSLPMYSSLQDEELTFVQESIREFVKNEGN